jgi:NodT family efflux transporter outer membrane factor (OMF) lipoprotein
VLALDLGARRCSSCSDPLQTLQFTQRISPESLMARRLPYRPGMRRLLAAILFTTACAAPAVSYHAEMPMPATFSASGSQALPDRWWTAFGDPSLTKLVDQALAGNLDLRIAWTRLEQAKAVTRGAIAAQRPSVSGGVEGDLSSKVGNGSNINESVSADLQASYEVDLWGRLAAARDSAQFEEQATEQDVQAAAITLTGEITSTYYQLVQARASDALLQQQLDSSNQTLTLVQKRVAAGLAPIDDQLRQEQAVEALNGSRAAAAQQIATLEYQLAVLVGQPPTADVAPADATLVALPALPATGVPSQLLQKRPDVIAAYLRIESADQAVAQAIAARYPRLTLSAKTSIEAPFTGWLASLAAGLAGPIYDGGALKAQQDRARASLAEAVLSYQSTVLGAAQDVEDALVAEARGQDQLTSLDKQIQLAQQAADNEQQRYTAGLSDYLAVLTAQQSLQGLQRQRLTQQGALLQNRIALYRALAGSWGLSEPSQTA